jgi:general L-amino acid transport system permease protein
MPAFIKSIKFRNAILQASFLATILLLIVAAVVIGKRNLEAQGITSGFAFLSRATGFDIGFSLIEFGPFDTFGRLIIVGLLNTILMGIIGVVLANIIGLFLAIFRTSHNGVLNAIGTLYIETFRNIPMILQTFFWYMIVTNLPRPKQAHHLLELVFLSSRGLYTPKLNVTNLSATIFFVIIVVFIVLLVWFSISRLFKKLPKIKRDRIRLTGFLVALFLGITTLALGRLPDTSLWSIPALRGLNIRGGLQIPPEFSALAISMGIYGGSYVGEIIRAGFLAVGKGQVEAAKSLGLSPWYVFKSIRMPLAIRAVLPTLISQYTWLFKGTTLGIAIGFTDFFSVISVSINQAGQTLELIGILMLGFLVMNNSISIVLNRVNKAIELKGTQLNI